MRNRTTWLFAIALLLPSVAQAHGHVWEPPTDVEMKWAAVTAVAVGAWLWKRRAG